MRGAFPFVGDAVQSTMKGETAMRLRNRGVIAACLLLLAWASPAAADVDVELDAKSKVSGSLDVDETETFRFDGTAGMQLSLSVKAKKKADLDLAVQLIGPSGPIDLTGGSAFQDAGKKLKIKGVVLPQNGRHTLVLTAAGSGEYSLKLTLKPQKTFVEVAALPASGDGVLTFSAPRGAKAVIKVTQADGSEAVPLIGGPLPLKKAPGDSVTFPSLDREGLQEFVVTNQAAAAGAVNVTVKVTPAKAKTSKIDVRARSLGDPIGGETAVSATVLAATGGEVGVIDPDSSILGAGVLIPPGALNVDTRISVTSTSLIDPPSPVTQQPAGPAIEFGPDGLEFGQPAEVTVPFDPSALPLGVDPNTDLLVLRESSDGSQEVIAPTSVDVPNGVCVVPTDGFSVFMSFVRRGVPDVTGDAYWFAGFELCVLPDFLGGADSREREIFLFAGNITFGRRGVTDDTVVNIVESNTSFDHDDTGRGLVNAPGETPLTELATWDLEPDGRTLRVDFDLNDQVLYRTAEDGSVLVSRPGTGTDEDCVILEIAVPRPSSAPTPTSVAGRFWFGGIDASVTEDPGGQGPLLIDVSSAFGEMELRGDGSWSVDIDSAANVFDPQIGLTTRTGGQADSGTFRITGPEDGALEGSILISGSQGPDFLRILPSADGQTIIAFSPSIGDEGGGFFLGTRMTTSLTRADVAGEFGGRSIGVLGLNTYQVPGGEGPVTVGDFSAVFEADETRTFAANGDLVFSDVFIRNLSRDPTAGPDGVRRFAQFIQDDEVLRFAVGSDGKFRIAADNVVGAFTSSGVFGFAVGDPRAGIDTILDVHVRLPALPGGEVEPDF